MPKKTKTAGVERTLYQNYLKKAEKFHLAAESSFKALNYEAAALASIHCVISSIDAYLVFKSGIRSASERHADAIKLFAEAAGMEEGKPAIRHAEYVLGEKTAVEYFDTLVTEKQASEIIKHTKRFYEWVTERLPKNK